MVLLSLIENGINWHIFLACDYKYTFHPLNDVFRYNNIFAITIFWWVTKDIVIAKLDCIYFNKRFFVACTSVSPSVYYSRDVKPPWFVIDYCQLGFIGKLFRSSDLPRLAQFFLMFYDAKPVDWLLEDLLHTMVCHLDHDHKKCNKEKARVRVRYKPSLFQHIGTHSSLRGELGSE